MPGSGQDATDVNMFWSRNVGTYEFCIDISTSKKSVFRAKISLFLGNGILHLVGGNTESAVDTPMVNAVQRAWLTEDLQSAHLLNTVGGQ